MLSVIFNVQILRLYHAYSIFKTSKLQKSKSSLPNLSERENPTLIKNQVFES